MAAEETVNLDFLEGVKHPSDDAPSEDDLWFTDDSPVSSYFDIVNLPGHPEGVGNLVFGLIGYDNVGLDLAGGTNGVALKTLRASDVIVRGLATSYRDNRDSRVRVSRHDEDIDRLAGDLIRPKTWERIITWQKQNASDGLGIVMWRPVAALQNLPPSFYRGAAHLLLNMTRPGGVLFAQVPTSLRPEWPVTEDKAAAAQELEKLCASISDREDVAEVLVCEQLDKKEHCALIVKS